MAGRWRFIAQRHEGLGVPGPVLHSDLPLNGSRVQHVVSGASRITGNISPALKTLKGKDGRALLQEYQTIIHAERDGVISASAIYVDGGWTDGQWSLDCMGVSGYPWGMVYSGEKNFIEVEALDVVRHIWDHLQGQRGGNLGVQLDRTTMSGVNVGKPLREVEFTTDEGETVSFDAGPFRLSQSSDHDCGKRIEDLAEDGGFQWRERSAWDDPKAKNEVLHHIEFGKPFVGRRIDDIRFILRENVFTMPTIQRPGNEFANEVLVLGAGEGPDRVQGKASTLDQRIRRTATVEDKSIDSVRAAEARARRELAWRQNFTTIQEFRVLNKPMSRLGSWREGDELRLQMEGDYFDTDMWVRVLSLTEEPGNPEEIAMSVIPSDRLL